MSSKIELSCGFCGKKKFLFPSQVKTKKYGTFCNRDCLGLFRSKTLTGALAANFKSGTRKDREYIGVSAPWHPYNVKGYVYLHRLLCEAKLKRLLFPDEIVHHIDHDPENNHWDNLEAMTQVEHARLHLTERGKDGRIQNKKRD